ncbi:MAG: hypothetical protein ALECFALPRED_000078 [Alectoria fallacina]|uniref:Uncharacterized protein n=1 Tax=Alectoria fallacina TaxID=1903189 RepID=A0A8H3EH82_9LECA|nr:MAG: hypothetical protein ALECFALPRED_000078 [Alectoria fallacina]
MSSGWIGPGARGAPQNQEEIANYKAIKAQVEKDEKEKREAENAMRASQGLPPLKDSFWSRVKKGVQKAMMM